VGDESHEETAWMVEALSPEFEFNERELEGQTKMMSSGWITHR
jgi:hypothetical protein